MRHWRLLLGATGLVFSLAAGAQAYPAKPPKLVIPSTPGGSADVVGRAIAQRLSETWAQPVVVENRPGGSDIIGVDYVAKSAADGYTWLLATNSVLVNAPHLVKLPFDVFADFTPVLQVVTVPFLLVVHPSVPAGSVSELIEYSKANPDKLSYGSSGTGAHGHLVGELLKRSSGISMLHVPYKGSAPTITDLVGGRLQVYVGVAGQMMPHIKAGKLRALASAGAKRRADFPGLPTIAETVPGFGTKLGDPWLGLFMPANVPPAIVTRVNADAARVLNTPETRTFLAGRGFDVATTSPEGLASILRDDFANWGRVIREAGIKAD
jgi:tripartite-type tricarboxylate transporter receptor subunit TctC